MSEVLTFPIRSDKLTMSAKVKKTLYKKRSEFQEIEIVETEVFGKALLLDGHIQLTEMDEHAYHEALVQIPLLNLASPKRALVIGGGDGGVVRELTKCASLESIDMVEIDRQVIEACLNHFPISKGAFDDARVHVHIADAFQFVKEVQPGYDLIVMDSTDTYEDEADNLSEMLFTKAFYEDLKRLLSSVGVVVTQADNMLFCPYSLESISKLYGEVFTVVGSYWGIVPSFGGFSGFCYASNTTALDGSAQGKSFERFRYLNPATYNLAFSKLGIS